MFQHSGAQGVHRAGVIRTQRAHVRAQAVTQRLDGGVSGRRHRPARGLLVEGLGRQEVGIDQAGEQHAGQEGLAEATQRRGGEGRRRPQRTGGRQRPGLRLPARVRLEVVIG
jgi:hypothetical protein